MKKMTKFMSVALAAALSLSLAACGNTTTDTQSGNSKDGADSYTVGVCQLVEHPALDSATQGFVDALTEKLGDKVTFDMQNAQGDSATCSTICTTFVSNQYDLIFANATPALQAAVAATNQIPVLGTSITDYATALQLDDWTGVTGMNVSGTSDLAPLDKQAECIKELFPDAKTVGILYCSAEPNSLYQANVITGHLENAGYTVNTYTFADSNDVASVTQNACNECDVLYIPTDNTAASCTEAINNVATKPIFCGEEGICKGCGVATLSINYYDIGYESGLMAYEILVNGADPATMEVKFAPEVVKEYNVANADKYSLTIPSDYKAIEE